MGVDGAACVIPHRRPQDVTQFATTMPDVTGLILPCHVDPQQPPDPPASRAPSPPQTADRNECWRLLVIHVAAPRTVNVHSNAGVEQARRAQWTAPLSPQPTSSPPRQRIKYGHFS